VDDEIFPCIRCGADVYHAANVCPQCGLELYPAEEADEELPLITPPRPPARPGLLRRLLGAFTGRHASGRLARAPLDPPTPGEDTLYIELLQRAHYDADTVARLLAHERTRAAGPTPRATLLRRAIARWDRDNQ
jgi:hypothetical protein